MLLFQLVEFGLYGCGLFLLALVNHDGIEAENHGKQRYPADQAAADAQEREDESDNDVGHRIFFDPESEECQGSCDKCVDNSYAEPDRVSLCSQNEPQRADGR